MPEPKNVMLCIPKLLIFTRHNYNNHTSVTMAYSRLDGETNGLTVRWMIKTAATLAPLVIFQRRPTKRILYISECVMRGC